MQNAAAAEQAMASITSPTFQPAQPTLFDVPLSPFGVPTLLSLSVLRLGFVGVCACSCGLRVEQCLAACTAFAGQFAQRMLPSKDDLPHVCSKDTQLERPAATELMCNHTGVVFVPPAGMLKHTVQQHFILPACAHRFACQTRDLRRGAARSSGNHVATRAWWHEK